MNKDNNNNNKGYGLISMMAMIIGIVIGSGIFVKNAGLMSINNSILYSTIAWIVGSLIVITMLIAFLEIFSITEIADEQSTLSNWGRHLFGVRFGKFIGYYFTLVYLPIIMAALFVFASTQFIDTLVASGAHGIENIVGSDNGLQYLGLIMAFAVVFLVGILIMNALTTKPGKHLQNVGTAIKTIPLFFVIILFVVILITNVHSIDFTQSLPADQVDIKTTSGFALILMTLPSILFAFDGFLLAGALSKEAKSPTTFRTASIFSIMFIIIIYILFSLAIFGLGDVTAPGYGTITNTIHATMTEGAANVIAPMVSGIIWISILTGASGCSIASSRMLSDLSAHNAVVDKNSNYITKNKYGVSSHAGLTILAVAFGWFILMMSFDMIVVSTEGYNPEVYSPIAITGYMSDLIVIGAFLLYSTIIIGGLINRKTENVKVEKNMFFIPCALISSIFTIGLTLYFTYTTLVPAEALSQMSHYDLSLYICKLAAFFLFLGYIAVITILNIYLTENKLETKVVESKKEALKVYYN